MNREVTVEDRIPETREDAPIYITARVSETLDQLVQKLTVSLSAYDREIRETIYFSPAHDTTHKVAAALRALADRVERSGAELEV